MNTIFCLPFDHQIAFVAVHFDSHSCDREISFVHHLIVTAIGCDVNLYCVVVCYDQVLPVLVHDLVYQ